MSKDVRSKPGVWCRDWCRESAPWCRGATREVRLRRAPIGEERLRQRLLRGRGNPESRVRESRSALQALSRPYPGGSTMPRTNAPFTTRGLDSFVKQAKRTRKVVERGDGHDHAGLRFRASPTGTATWFYRYRDGTGALRMERLGDFEHMGLKEARTRRDDLAAARDPSGNLVAVDVPQHTFVEVLDAYLAAISATGNDAHIRSWREVRRSLDRDALPTWRDRPAADIARADVQALLDAVTARGSPLQANRLFSYVRRLFNWAVESGRYALAHSPCDRMKRPNQEKERDEWLKPPELRSLLRDLARHVSKDVTDVLLVMLRTGQRKGEVCGMRADELDLTGEPPTWYLPAERTKNSRAHDVPLPPQVVAILAPRVEDGQEGFVFPGRDGGALRGDSVNDAWSNARAALKLPRFRPHDLRHHADSRIMPNCAARER